MTDWPKSKVPHPHIGPRIGFCGCYFSEAGINPLHDEFFVPMNTEAPAILRWVREAGPDLKRNRLLPTFIPRSGINSLDCRVGASHCLYRARGRHNVTPPAPR